MNRLLLLALIGGALYWLFKEPVPGGGQRRLSASGTGLDPEDEQELLDEAIEESFPASDPPAVTPPKH